MPRTSSKGTPRGVEQSADSPENEGVAAKGGAESGALGVGSVPDDPELRAIVDAWSRLPEAIRAGIVAMIRAVE